MYKFNVVVLKSKDNKYFVCKLPEFVKQRGTIMIYRLINYKNVDGDIVYKKLKQEVDAGNKFAHQISANLYSKDDANDKVYKIQQDLVAKYGEECILNDLIINPEKFKCICGKNVRVQFKEEHQKYCEPNEIIVEDL